MGTSEISVVINKKEDVLIINKDENKNREKWQKPEIVMALMGDLKDKNVADIGAGTGYFTFRIAMKAKKVIAIDIEKNYLDILDNLKEKLPEEIQSKIETRLAKVNDPLLKSGEVDLVVIINTFSFIKNKKEYLKIIKKDLKPNGRIFIVDFKMKNLPIDAPDESDRLPLNKLENLLEKAGFKNIQSDDTTLDYQYIVIADK
jgi:2-polyprenyl-3-methyl-5-hydroxy-6-metoxy-1,4-benzoquinol methylase